MVRTIKASKSSTDSELVEICKTELNCDECRIESGPSTETIYQTSPPENTVAVVIDISSVGGSLNIHQTSDNKWGNVFIGMVGMEDSENGDRLVILPWEARWYYRSLGAIKIKYAVKK